MKKLLFSFLLIAGIISSAAAGPMGHFHRSPHHHGHSHHHHTRLNTIEEQRPVH